MKLLTISIIIILLLASYWFLLRPIQIRQECTITAKKQSIAILKLKGKLLNDDQAKYLLSDGEVKKNNLYLSTDYDHYFVQCLNEKGL